MKKLFIILSLLLLTVACNRNQQEGPIEIQDLGPFRAGDIQLGEHSAKGIQSGDMFSFKMNDINYETSEGTGVQSFPWLIMPLSFNKEVKDAYLSMSCKLKYREGSKDLFNAMVEKEDGNYHFESKDIDEEDIKFHLRGYAFFNGDFVRNHVNRGTRIIEAKKGNIGFVQIYFDIFPGDIRQDSEFYCNMDIISNEPAHSITKRFNIRILE